MRATALPVGAVVRRVAGGLLVLAAACNGLLGNQDAVLVDGGSERTGDGGPDARRDGAADARSDGAADTARHADEGADRDATRGLDAAATDGSTCTSSAPPETDASSLTDPLPTEVVNAGVSFVYHKDLSGDPMYGDSGADLLFSGQVGAWHFGLPTGSFTSAQVAVSLVADDHATGPAVGYTFDIWSEACHTPTKVLPHGSPDPGFTNWVEVTEPTDRKATSLVVTMKNTSDPLTVGPGAWIGVDWIELRLFE